jgi:2-deoxy-D-gluconate 3-dehydrogenase
MGKPLTEFSLDIFSLKGKTAVITGANQGLGMAYAIAMAKVGADIFIPHLTDDVSQVKEAIESAGGSVFFLQGDLTERGYRGKIIDACLGTFGKIDILVNNAGMNYMAPLLEYPNEMWERVMELQLHTVYHFSREVASIMVKNGGGKIINIASALSFAADYNAAAYTIAKHGVVGLTKSFAAELGTYNIQCNAIAPGFYDSEMSAMVRETNPHLANKVCDRIPSSHGNWGDVYDLMGAVVFLASDASNYITGCIINVDGGFQAVLV